jgi:aspartate racemase
MKYKKLGILSGMGPDVTAAFVNRIINFTPANCEQEHIPLLIYHNPQIPDRTSAILNHTESPVPEMKRCLSALVDAGMEILAIPCNTAHYYYNELQNAVQVPIIHLIKTVVSECITINKNLKTVGLLATSGTVATGLYQNEFKQNNVEVILPSKHNQNEIMRLIYDIKARKSLHPITNQFIKIAKKLADDSAEIILIGCTDISSVLSQNDISIPLTDSLDVLAEESVKQATEA